VFYPGEVCLDRKNFLVNEIQPIDRGSRTSIAAVILTKVVYNN
jgi:hypothetical protein